MSYRNSSDIMEFHVPLEESLNYFNLDELSELKEKIEYQNRIRDCKVLGREISRCHPYEWKLGETINDDCIFINGKHTKYNMWFDSIPDVSFPKGTLKSDIANYILALTGLSVPDLMNTKTNELSLTYSGYIFKVNTEEIELENPEDQVTCNETGLWLFKELAYPADLFDRPYQVNPEVHYFLNDFFYDCFIGHVYSKDFGYEYCEGCDRYICEQDPSCGWTTHFRSIDEEGYYRECLKCVNDRMEEGEFSKPEIFGEEYYGKDNDDCVEIDGKKYKPYNKSVKFPANFVTPRDEAGYEIDESFSFVNHHNIKKLNKYCLEKIKDNCLIIIQLNHMSIIGDEGYIDLWIKKGGK